MKQADLVLAMHLRGDAFTAAEKARNFDYYEGITVRDSSLSAATQAVLAAEVGHLRLAQDYLAEAALMDLDDLGRNTRDGLHIACLAGVWTALVAGFGGMRSQGPIHSFAPQLPEALTRLKLRLLLHGQLLEVEITRTQVTYALADGPPMTLDHRGERLLLTAETPITRTLPPPPALARPTQPEGRAPRSAT